MILVATTVFRIGLDIPNIKSVYQYGAVLMDAGAIDDPRLEAIGRLALERLIEGP